MRPLLSCLFWLVSAVASAQIIVPPDIQSYRLFDLKLDDKQSTGEQSAWACDDGIDWREISTGRGIVCTGTPGKHRVFFVYGDRVADRMGLLDVARQIEAGTLKVVAADVTIGGEPAPDAISFSASPQQIKAGESATLIWKTSADSVTINGVSVTQSGTQEVTPDKTATYTLVATTGAAKVTRQIVVTVGDDPTPGPVEKLSAVIVYESSGALTPGQSDICKGKSLQDWFAASKHELLRVDKDATFEGMPKERVDIIKSAILYAIASGKDFPLVVWTGKPGGSKTVEPIKADAETQIERFKEIAGVKK